MKSIKLLVNSVECDNNSKSLLSSIKYAYIQYKSDLKYVRGVSKIWYGKPYRGLITKLSIAWHNFYWRVIKTN